MAGVDRAALSTDQPRASFNARLLQQMVAVKKTPLKGMAKKEKERRQAREKEKKQPFKQAKKKVDKKSEFDRLTEALRKAGPQSTAPSAAAAPSLPLRPHGVALQMYAVPPTQRKMIQTGITIIECKFDGAYINQHKKAENVWYAAKVWWR